LRKIVITSEESEVSEPVGIIGVGIMGSAMARNMIKSGFSVVGFDPSPAARDRLTAMGGIAMNSPKEVAEVASISILSLPSADALDMAIAGTDGMAKANGHRQIGIECSTLQLSAKRAAQKHMEAHGKILLDCPISGTGAQAEKKDLVVFGSGDEQAFNKCNFVFEGMSRAHRYLGPFGNGSMMKFIANHPVTIHNVAAAEAMVFALRAGLDSALVYQTLEDSAAASRGPLMRDSSYDHPTATVRTHLKDISIIDSFAAEVGCALPLYSVATQVYRAGDAMGFGGSDTASVCAVLEAMNGVNRLKR
jgi:L-threonate 2-dehydrogenase